MFTSQIETFCAVFE